ncbi:hypothetical protein BE221DRAFT_189089 [Ostreococcus tauri]|uniref:Gag1-like clamp domain-containing protein n=1 Tax=Ostreococcus tauri TaxID=70448 RepID=A0A1Y5IGN1_OSTTA|nr:hypothetical protein BE221DRAFT_189089 [Ostreococcus tauri]
MWVNRGRTRQRARDGGRTIPRSASYDSLLGAVPASTFPRPIPLAEMVRFLTACWETGDGL